MSGEYIAFFLLAILAISGGMLLINLDKVMHMVLALILSFLSIAGIYILLSAEFVAVVQIMVYSGAVAIIMIFGIMLTKHHGETRSLTPIIHRILLLLAIGAFAGVVYYGIVNMKIPIIEVALHESNTEHIGRSLFSDYIIPFEIMSIILLVALIGAIVLAKKNKVDGGDEK